MPFYRCAVATITVNELLKNAVFVAFLFSLCHLYRKFSFVLRWKSLFSSFSYYFSYHFLSPFPEIKTKTKSHTKPIFFSFYSFFAVQFTIHQTEQVSKVFKLCTIQLLRFAVAYNSLSWRRTTAE